MAQGYLNGAVLMIVAVSAFRVFVQGKNPALLQKDPSLFGQKLLEEGVPIKEVMRIVSAAKLRKQEQLDAARRKSSAHSRSGGGGNSSLSSLHSPSTSVYPSSLSSSSVHTVTRCHNVMRGSDSGMRASPSSNPSSVESGACRDRFSVQSFLYYIRYCCLYRTELQFLSQSAHGHVVLVRARIWIFGCVPARMRTQAQCMSNLTVIIIVSCTWLLFLIMCALM